MLGPSKDGVSNPLPFVLVWIMILAGYVATL